MTKQIIEALKKRHKARRHKEPDEVDLRPEPVFRFPFHLASFRLKKTKHIEEEQYELYDP